MNLKPVVDIQTKVIHLITKLIQELDYDADEAITSDTMFVKDIGFASLDFVQMIVTIEEDFGQKLGFQNLLVKNGAYIDDLTVGELIVFITRQLQSSQIDIDTPSIQPKPSVSMKSFEEVIPLNQRVNAEKIAQFRQSIRPRQLRQEPSSQKNPRAIFVLCPPRSGSTLLRVILAGHPQLFSPPELYLLMYNDLAQRKHELANESNSHLLEGTIRSIMQLKGCSADEAENIMQECEQSQMGTKQFYALLQELMSDRILVDKTPLYPLDINILKRAEEDFTEPLYIHLIRHPYGTIRSYEESKLDRFVPAMYENPFQRRELAELTWLVSHQNIIAFLKDIPQQRWMPIKFEDLVTQPQKMVEQICQFLNLDFDLRMLSPYEDRQQRMLEGTRKLTRMPGDLKLHLHQGIDADTADRWKQFFTGDFLGNDTWEVAESLGYSAADIP